MPEPEPEPRIFNVPVARSVDETAVKIFFDLLELRRKLPMPWQQFREMLIKIIEHHTGYKCDWTELRAGGVLQGNISINDWYKFYCNSIEITLRNVVKERDGFDWIIKDFRVQKVERVVLVR